MSDRSTGRRQDCLVYKLDCGPGHRYLVYNASVLENPPGHVPGKWYVRPYPEDSTATADPAGPFDTADAVEWTVRTGRVRTGAEGPSCRRRR
jgi:hypothetical protein